MANTGYADERRWKRVIEQQKEEMEKVTNSFKEFFHENKDLTVEELRKFISAQTQQVESSKVRSDLNKRLKAVDKLSEKKDLSGEDLINELNEMSQNFHDGLNVLSDTVTKGNELLSSGFSKISGVLRESFGPVFDLFDSGWNVVTGIYSSLVGMLSFIKVIPTLLGSLKAWFMMPNKQDKKQTEYLSSMNNYFKRKEKRELRSGSGEDSLINRILKGIGILGLGIIGAFIMFTENVTKSFLSAFKTIDDVVDTKLVIPIVKFFKRFKITQKILGVFSKIGDFIKIKFASPILGFLSKFKISHKIMGVFSAIGKKISSIGNWGTQLITWLNGVVKNGGFITRKIARLSLLLVKFGGFLGTWFLPLQMAYETIKGVFDPGTIRDKILSASAGVLSVITEIPEMIANAILWLFGSEFRFNFGKEVIIDAVNVATEWFEKPIHAMLDFFTKTIPETFSNLWSFLNQWGQSFINIGKDTIALIKGKISIPEFLKNLGNNIVNVVQGLFDVISWPFDFFIITPIKTLIGWFTGSPDASRFKETVSMLKSITQKLFDVVIWPFKTFIINPIKGLIGYFTTNKEEPSKTLDMALSLSKKVFDVVTWPFKTFIIDPMRKLINFFTSDMEVPDVFETIVNWAKEIPLKIKNWVLGWLPSWEGIKGAIASKIPASIPDWMLPKWAEGGGNKEGAVKSGPKIDKSTITSGIDTRAILKYEEDKIKLYKEMRDYLSKMLEIYKEQNDWMMNQQKEQNKDPNGPRINPNTSTEPPDEIESMGLLLFNKSWGMG